MIQIYHIGDNDMNREIPWAERKRRREKEKTYPPINEADIQRALIWAYGIRALAATINSTLDIFNSWEADFLRVTDARWVYEYEVKITVADFRKDFTDKHKHQFLSNPALRENRDLPNYFYFAVPEKIAERVRPYVPEYAGLIIITDHVLYEHKRRPVYDIHYAKEAPRLHTQKASDKYIQRVMLKAMRKLLRRV